MSSVNSMRRVFNTNQISTGIVVKSSRRMRVSRRNIPNKKKSDMSNLVDGIDQSRRRSIRWFKKKK